MSDVVNVIDEVWDGRPRVRDWERVRGIMLHRCGVNLVDGVTLGHTAVEVCRAFQTTPEIARVTGGENPYTLMIGGALGGQAHDGTIWQCLPLDEVGPHARQFSVHWLGLGLIADPRVREVSALQWISATSIVAELCLALRLDPYKQVKGHGEEPLAHGGTKAPGMPDACPGDLFDINAFRYDVEQLMIERARRRLHDSGLVFNS